MVTQLERTPAALLEALENGELAAGGASGFGHREHLAVAWELVGRERLGHAIERMAAALRRVVTVLGAPEKYNETLTWTWMVVVAERRAEAPEDEDFAGFLARNGDLLDPRATLATYYAPAELDGAVARSRFVLPRRGGRPWLSARRRSGRRSGRRSARRRSGRPGRRRSQPRSGRPRERS